MDELAPGHGCSNIATSSSEDVDTTCETVEQRKERVRSGVRFGISKVCALLSDSQLPSSAILRAANKVLATGVLDEERGDRVRACDDLLKSLSRAQQLSIFDVFANNLLTIEKQLRQMQSDRAAYAPPTKKSKIGDGRASDAVVHVDTAGPSNVCTRTECVLCANVFHTHVQYVTHKCMQQKECDWCGYAFEGRTSDEREKHFVNAHQKQSRCTTASNDRAAAKNVSSSSDLYFRCIRCQQKYPLNMHASHMKRCALYSCPKCARSYSWSYQRALHLLVAHDVFVKELTRCRKCNQCFSSPHKFREHLPGCLRCIVALSNGRFKCVRCSNILKTLDEACLLHAYRLHVCDKLQWCSKCGVRQATEFRLRQHITLCEHTTASVQTPVPVDNSVVPSNNSRQRYDGQVYVYRKVGELSHSSNGSPIEDVARPHVLPSRQYTGQINHMQRPIQKPLIIRDYVTVD